MYKITEKTIKFIIEINVFQFNYIIESDKIILFSTISTSDNIPNVFHLLCFNSKHKTDAI